MFAATNTTHMLHYSHNYAPVVGTAINGAMGLSGISALPNGFCTKSKNSASAFVAYKAATYLVIIRYLYLYGDKKPLLYRLQNHRRLR